MSPATLVRPVAADPDRLRALACARPDEFPVLLDSAASGPLARYTLLAAWPQGRLVWGPQGLLEASGVCGQFPPAAGFLETLAALWRCEAGSAALGGPQPVAGTPGTDPVTGLPFTGGWFVHLGYELAAGIEPRLAPLLAAQRPDSWGITGCAWRIPAALLFEHATARCWAVAEAGQPALLERLEAALVDAAVAAPVARTAAPRCVDIREDEPQDFLDQVVMARAAIAAGDVYQANLARGWHLQLRRGAHSVAALYERLRQANPAPFAALLQLGERALLSSSPERLVAVRGDAISTRPIAGTRPRHVHDDARELAELIGHPKERAEHVMLIDLERNDLGRLCVAGSVQVDEFMVLESYAHVHHIVSQVSGRLRTGVTPVEVLRAVFPGGTITGCPKLASMQLIARLEGVGRGPYTGSVGYLNHDGSLDFNILIRTLSLVGEQLTLRAGAGIVADSVPEQELAETRAKARGLLLALGLSA